LFKLKKNVIFSNIIGLPAACIGVMIIMGYTSRKEQGNTVGALKWALLIFDHIFHHTLNQTIPMVYIALEYHYYGL